MVINSQVGARGVLALLCGAPFLAGLDQFVVNVAFAEIGADFPDHPLTHLGWVLSGYSIVFAALLVPAGRYADRVGHKRVFVAGLALFTLASAVAAASPGLWALVACRLVQAVGAAALTPTSLSLLLASVAPERRGHSVRIWAATGAIASALGPVVGGVLVELSWRWIFLINVPVGVVLVVLAVRMLPDHHGGDTGQALDLPGALLLTVGIGALAVGVVQANEWTPANVLVSLVVAAVALAAFTVRTLRHPAPLISRALLRVRTFSWSVVASLLFSATFAAGLLALVLWLQDVWGYSAIRTGLALAPGPLAVPVFAIGGQALLRRFTPGVLAGVGCLVWAAGSVLLLVSVGPSPDYLGAVLPGWLLAGIGVGLAFPTILSSATAELPPASSATGSAVVTMARQVGAVLGVSVLIAVLGRPNGYEAAHAAFQASWWTVAGLGVVAAVVAWGISPRPVRA
ncbi:MAG: MFS transporter [Saccharothrix sp.]|nr:MFS transporter [Saccharothrix sp.]